MKNESERDGAVPQSEGGAGVAPDGAGDVSWKDYDPEDWGDLRYVNGVAQERERIVGIISDELAEAKRNWSARGSASQGARRVLCKVKERIQGGDGG